MKKNIIRFFLLASFAFFFAPIFSSCSDDELDGCGLTVVVKDAANTSNLLQGATISISKESGSVKRDGVSDANGEAYFFFDNEAILDIDVSYGEAPNTRYGKSTVRLKYGEVVRKEVLVQ